MVRSTRIGLTVGLLALWGLAAEAQEPVGIVSQVKVLSDKVPDVSSMEAWKRSCITDGMSDRDKGLAIWRTVVAFRHQDSPPNEYLQGEDNVHDPIKTFNVYGYGMCCCAASNVEALARYLGLKARGRIIHAHSLPEVWWDGAWHMLDASLINYFPQPDGSLAGVDDVIAGLRAWYEKNPGFKGNNQRLSQFMQGGGWRKGPQALALCPFYDNNGWLPAATHGWYSTMQEYDCKPGQVYEYGYSQGYQVNVQLRPGERLVRTWFAKGLHVNMAGGGAPGCLDGHVGQGDLRYAPQYGDVSPGRVGNGTRRYDVPLSDGQFRGGALEAENLACSAEDRQAPAVHVKDPEQPAVLVIDMPSSYVYLSGQLSLKATVAGGGSVAVSLSDNNGLAWKDVATLSCC